MRRRTFLGSLAAPVVVFPAPDPYGSSTVNKTTITAIGARSLEQLRDFHKRELGEEYIKLWDKSGIDRQYGGFFPEANEEGDPVWSGNWISLNSRWFVAAGLRLAIMNWR